MKNKIKISDSLIDRLSAIKNDSKAARLLLLLNERGTTLRLPANYVHLRKSGFISYMPANRAQEVNESGKWISKGRQECKPARLFSALRLVNLLSMSDLDVFARLLAKREEGAKVEESEKVARVYGIEHVKSFAVNYLSKSCMNDERISDAAARFYLYEAAGCSIIYIMSGPDLSARAVVWHGVLFGDARISVVDRMYYSHNYEAGLITEYARARGYYIRGGGSYSTAGELADVGMHAPDGSALMLSDIKKMRVHVKGLEEMNEFPYLDSFRYSCGDYLQPDMHGAEYEYTCTGGGRDTINQETCDNCNDVNPEGHNSSVIVSVGRSQSWCESCRDNNAIYADNRGEWIDSDCTDFTFVDTSAYRSHDVVVLCNGENAHVDDAFEYDGEFYHVDELAHVEFDGASYDIPQHIFEQINNLLNP
jgi:hypothetical protein